MRYGFIERHRREFPVQVMCDVLRVTRSGYYAWRTRAPSATARRQAELAERITQAHRQSDRRYGAIRVQRELAAEGVRCSKNTVAKLMRREGLRSKRCARFVVRTTDSRHGHRIAPNRLNRRFQQRRPNRAWVADLTYIPTAEGWLYLAVVLDLYSRKVVGWATSDSLAADVTCEALRRALVDRRPPARLLHHSDRGVQYACDAYQHVLSSRGLRASMSRKGNCYDNAVVESFFSTLKTELVHHERYATRAAARQSLFEYIEVFYNRRRRHSSLGYVSPHEFEEAAARRNRKEVGGLKCKAQQADNTRTATASARDLGRGLAGRRPNRSTLPSTTNPFPS
jgi:transposase InsO family protein